MTKVTALGGYGHLWFQNVVFRLEGLPQFDLDGAKRICGLYLETFTNGISRNIANTNLKNSGLPFFICWVIYSPKESVHFCLEALEVLSVLGNIEQNGGEGFSELTLCLSERGSPSR